jgi:hypothetical protein
MSVILVLNIRMEYIENKEIQSLRKVWKHSKRKENDSLRNKESESRACATSPQTQKFPFSKVDAF